MMSKAPDLIDIRDYSRNEYTHYWETHITANADGFEWRNLYYPYDPDVRLADGGDLFTQSGRSPGKEAARFDAQSAILDQMPKFRKTDGG